MRRNYARRSGEMIEGNQERRLSQCPLDDAFKGPCIQTFSISRQDNPGHCDTAKLGDERQKYFARRLCLGHVQRERLLCDEIGKQPRFTNAFGPEDKHRFAPLRLGQEPRHFVHAFPRGEISL